MRGLLSLYHSFPCSTSLLNEDSLGDNVGWEMLSSQRIWNQTCSTISSWYQFCDTQSFGGKTRTVALRWTTYWCSLRIIGTEQPSQRETLIAFVWMIMKQELCCWSFTRVCLSSGLPLGHTPAPRCKILSKCFSWTIPTAPQWGTLGRALLWIHTHPPALCRKIPGRLPYTEPSLLPFSGHFLYLWAIPSAPQWRTLSKTTTMNYMHTPLA